MSKKIIRARSLGDVTAVSDTGEIIEILPRLKAKPKEAFCMMFLKESPLPPLMRYMLLEMDFNNIVHLDRLEAASVVGVSPSSIYTLLHRFSEYQWIAKAGNGRYMVNPFMFGKGRWENVLQNRDRFIKLTQKAQNERQTP